MKLYPLLLASLVSASVARGAIDFFALPEKIVVPKSVTPSTAPVPPPPAPAATPAPLPPTSTNPRPLTPPLPPEEAPVLTFDGRYLKTPFVGTENPSAQSFYDVGPNQGVLIGFQYTTGQNEAGGTGIESLTPLFLRSAGKMTGITRGPRGERPATVLEARPGYAVARVEIRAASVVEAMWITFARYENGALDHSESYKSEVIGGRGAHASQTTVRLRTDTRPFVGMYGKASNGINQFGLLVRKEASAPVVPAGKPPEPPQPFTPPGGTLLGKTPTPSPWTPPPAAPLPPGTLQVLACANESYTLFLNGREILSGNSSYQVQSGNFPVAKGDVFCAVVKNDNTEDIWFSLRVVRDGTTIFDAGDMVYQTTEPTSWKTSRLTSGFREPRVTTHKSKRMGNDARPRAARPAPKDSATATMYLKGVVQQ